VDELADDLRVIATNFFYRHALKDHYRLLKEFEYKYNQFLNGTKRRRYEY
jgi:hypothetical protein